MAFQKSEGGFRKRGGFRRRKKVCVFCGKDHEISYKDVNKLKRYISERGKILPRRITGNCAKHQESAPSCHSSVCAGLIPKTCRNTAITGAGRPAPVCCFLASFLCTATRKNAIISAIACAFWYAADAAEVPAGFRTGAERRFAPPLRQGTSGPQAFKEVP